MPGFSRCGYPMGVKRHLSLVKNWLSLGVTLASVIPGKITNKNCTEIPVEEYSRELLISSHVYIGIYFFIYKTRDETKKHGD